jgi:hypothetical protein
MRTCYKWSGNKRNKRESPSDYGLPVVGGLLGMQMAFFYIEELALLAKISTFEPYRPAASSAMTRKVNPPSEM